MGRECTECGDYLSRNSFSSNQWRKGPGLSRCKDCVSGVCYECPKCYREFNTQNELNMHMQVHRPRNVSCPVCGETRFRSGANAVQHVESGYCRGCRGRDNARRQIYGFASKQSGMTRYMTDLPQLTYGSRANAHDDVPDYPYRCPECCKNFRNLSQLLQHQDQKHNMSRMLTY